jgi:hypothetical protein
MSALSCSAPSTICCIISHKFMSHPGAPALFDPVRATHHSIDVFNTLQVARLPCAGPSLLAAPRCAAAVPPPRPPATGLVPERMACLAVLIHC